MLLMRRWMVFYGISSQTWIIASGSSRRVWGLDTEDVTEVLTRIQVWETWGPDSGIDSNTFIQKFSIIPSSVQTKSPQLYWHDAAVPSSGFTAQQQVKYVKESFTNSAQEISPILYIVEPTGEEKSWVITGNRRGAASVKIILIY